MKLFMVIYIVGQIGGTVGPLPYGMEECQRRAAEMWLDGKPDVRTPEGFTRDDVAFKCEFHDQRPDNER